MEPLLRLLSEMQSSHSCLENKQGGCHCTLLGETKLQLGVGQRCQWEEPPEGELHGETQLTLVLKLPSRSAVSLLLPPPSCNTQCDFGAKDLRPWTHASPLCKQRRQQNLLSKSMDSISQRKIDTLRPYNTKPQQVSENFNQVSTSHVGTYPAQRCNSS